MKKYLENLTSSLKSVSLPFKLQKRERLIVSGGAVALVVLLFLQLMIFPILDKRAQLKKMLVAKTAELQQVDALKAEMASVSSSIQVTEEQLKKRPQGFTLFSFLDALAGRTGIKQNITYMKPTSANIKNSAYALSIVEMKIQALTMEQLVDYLHGVENAPQQIWIKQMSITRGENNEGLLTSILKVETYQL
jgi:general secretion pathway protein M